MEGFKKTIVHHYHPTQFREALQLSKDILTRPAEWDSHFRRSVASSVMSMIYDTPIKSNDDPAVHQINEQAARVTRAASPGANLVQFFPWLKYLPARCERSGNVCSLTDSIYDFLSIAKWKKDAIDWHERDSLVFEGLMHNVATRLVCLYLS